MGNPSYGDGEFLQGESLPNLMAQGLLRLLPAKAQITAHAAHIHRTSRRPRKEFALEENISAPSEGAQDVSDEISQKLADNGAVPSRQKNQKKHKKKHNYWAIKITIVTLFLSAFISYLTEITSSAGDIAITVVLLFFIVLAGIIADGIGVSVTSCDITPIVSMASKKEYGAKTAMWLVKNNEKVSNVCNDVIGDIISIISGSCGTVIVIAITVNLDESWQQWLSIGVSALISAVMVGGKAFLKNIAISKSKEFVMFVAKIIAIFHPEERRRRRRQVEKKKKYQALASKENGAAPKSGTDKAVKGKETAARANAAAASVPAADTSDAELMRENAPATEESESANENAADPAEGAPSSSQDDET